MKESLERALRKAARELLANGETMPEIRLTRPKLREHGDYASNLALQLSRQLGKPPRQVAEDLLARVVWPQVVASAEIAGPGFINIHLRQASETQVIWDVLRQGHTYGCRSQQERQKICLEFVSANPTGPMHVGHGRGAVVGDVLASVLQAVGHEVTREYYINDAGAQIGVLADSVWLRMRELQGEVIDFPESAYPGEYVIDIARTLLACRPYAEWQEMDADLRREIIGQAAVDANMKVIREDLAALGIEFDVFFSERELHRSGKVLAMIEELKSRGLVYTGILPPPKGKEVEDYRPVEQLLFRATDFGDDCDRPLLKQDGSPTYFAADIAYHHDKHLRGFDRMIDVWGADHGGYVARVQAAVRALTGRVGQPDILLVQMVNLTRDGKPVRMSKRAGTFVTLREVVDEVGRDAVRFNFMTRRAESQLDFDLAKAKEQSDENPVYYVQYAHARICAILRKAADLGISPGKEGMDLSCLASHEEKRLVKALLEYPEMLEKAAQRLEPYRVATYAMRLAADFHSFYHKYRVITEHKKETEARLALIQATRQVLSNALGILGVDAPERM
ncbi:MAG: arginine--tRNA ligase [Zetaproteobacteria bacterium]|nr:MAG: arginine--tRNA ligase [Zetaproteobacteria bacterium]